MRPVRICIYGGTDLQVTPTDFISALAYKILDSMSAVIVTGGFRHSNKNPNAISTDVAALRGAQRYAAKHEIDLKDCYEAWVPEPDLDSHKDAVRMSEPAVARHMIPIRLDRLPKSEAIYTSFADAIQSSSAVIADITALNENVMYEIGYSHGRGLTPLIYTREADRLTRLPVYFRTLNVRLASDKTPVNILIEDYLRSLKTTTETGVDLISDAVQPFIACVAIKESGLPS